MGYDDISGRDRNMADKYMFDASGKPNQEPMASFFDRCQLARLLESSTTGLLAGGPDRKTAAVWFSCIMPTHNDIIHGVGSTGLPLDKPIIVKVSTESLAAEYARRGRAGPVLWFNPTTVWELDENDEVRNTPRLGFYGQGVYAITERVSDIHIDFASATSGMTIYKAVQPRADRCKESALKSFVPCSVCGMCYSREFLYCIPCGVALTVGGLREEVQHGNVSDEREAFCMRKYGISYRELEEERVHGSRPIQRVVDPEIQVRSPLIYTVPPARTTASGVYIAAGPFAGFGRGANYEDTLWPKGKSGFTRQAQMKMSTTFNRARQRLAEDRSHTYSTVWDAFERNMQFQVSWIAERTIPPVAFDCWGRCYEQSIPEVVQQRWRDKLGVPGPGVFQACPHDSEAEATEWRNNIWFTNHLFDVTPAIRQKWEEAYLAEFPEGTRKGDKGKGKGPKGKGGGSFSERFRGDESRGGRRPYPDPRPPRPPRRELGDPPETPSGWSAWSQQRGRLERDARTDDVWGPAPPSSGVPRGQEVSAYGSPELAEAMGAISETLNVFGRGQGRENSRELNSADTQGATPKSSAPSRPPMTGPSATSSSSSSSYSATGAS